MNYKVLSTVGFGLRRWIGIIAAGVLLPACEKSDGDAVSGAPLTLTGPTEEVVLLEKNERETAVTFTWNKGIDRSPTDTVTYIFSMDLADNNFSTDLKTATPRDTITDFTKSFTVEELNELILEQWKTHPGEEVSLEARVVANVRGAKFVYPEIAVTKFDVVTYAYASVPLWITGTAVGSVPIQLTEQVNGRQYTWLGELPSEGDFKFVYKPNEELPSLNKGADDHTLVERTAVSQPDDRFQTLSGLHSINVDRKNMKINFKRFQYYFEHIYFVGDAVPAGWSPNDAVELTWDDGIFVYEGTLTGDNDGEDSFKILTKRDWDGWNLRPAQENAPITDNSLVAREGGDDWKWKIKPEETGNYRVTVDLSAMTITFEKN
ncbi:MAG: SusE domain-containing protein [Prevotellaceae bacterium]|jgi:hypothetical protein|nr:SusE domain-containing protein [Prevotellaceae bacterium]